MNLTHSEEAVAQRLIYGEGPATLKPTPTTVISNDDGTVRLQMGTTLYYAPLKRSRRKGTPARRSWPADGGSGVTVVAEDGAWVLGQRPICSSLDAMAMERNCAYVNVLGRAELIAAELCACHVAYPVGDGVVAYRAHLAAVEADNLERAAAQLEGREVGKLHWSAAWWAEMDAVTLATMRRHAAMRALGWNAPLDSYLRIAHDLALHLEPEAY